MIRALDGSMDMVSFKITSDGNVLKFFYDKEIKIKEEITKDQKTRFLAKGSDFSEFFKNSKNAFADNLIDYDLNGNELTLIFAEDSRRFVVCGNLETKEKTKLAEWYV